MMKCLDGTELFNKQPSSLTSYFLNPGCQEIVLRCRVLLPEYSGSGRGSIPMVSVHLTSMMVTSVSAMHWHRRERMTSDFTC